MTNRHSYFSHLVNVRMGAIEFSDPLRLPHGEFAVCRYELKDPSLLKPDLELGDGLTAYHALLPEIEGEWPSLPFFTEWKAQGEGAVTRARVNPDLLFAVALAMTEEFLVDGGYVVSNHEAEAYFSRYGHCRWPREVYRTDKETLVEALARARKEHPSWTNFGPWGNCYRLDGLRALGLDLIERMGGPTLTLVVLDPTGELCTALIQAADFHRLFAPERRPFRLVLVQEQPWAELCRAFEGQDPDPEALADPRNGAAVFPPKELVPKLVKGLKQLDGTAIALPPGARGADEALSEALALLRRTGFVDEEDEVVLLSL